MKRITGRGWHYSHCVSSLCFLYFALFSSALIRCRSLSRGQVDWKNLYFGRDPSGAPARRVIYDDAICFISWLRCGRIPPLFSRVFGLLTFQSFWKYWEPIITAIQWAGWGKNMSRSNIVRLAYFSHLLCQTHFSDRIFWCKVDPPHYGGRHTALIFKIKWIFSSMSSSSSSRQKVEEEEYVT